MRAAPERLEEEILVHSGACAARIPDIKKGSEREMSGWGCPHEVAGKCNRVRGFDCDPGMKGCVLFGRFRFSNENKNRGPKTPRPAEERRDSMKPPQSSSP
jgi:hypothetical protein